MGEFRDLDEFFTDELALPIGGKIYRVAGPDAETGLLCERLFSAGARAASGDQGAAAALARLDDGGERHLYQQVLGDVFDELAADGVGWPRIRHAGITAAIWVAVDRDTAVEYWNSGGQGKTQPRNRAERRASTSTGEASATRRRGSTSGTNSHRTSNRGRARRSRGGSSSPGGH